MKIKANMMDGTKANILMEDMGESVPAFDVLGNRYEAYTSRFVVNGKEMFSQVDKKFTKEQEDPAQFRLSEDVSALRDAGVDISTIKYGSQT